MANENNLKPVRTKKEARERGQRGGIASGKARRERADLRKQMQLWMETEVATEKDGTPLTGAEFMAKVAAKEISKGNARFWELARDTAGFKPIDRVMVAEVEQNVIDEVEAAVLGDD